MLRQLARSFVWIGLGVLATSVLATSGLAQNATDQATDHKQHQQTGETDLQSQLRDMQNKIAQLEAALKQNHSAPAGDGQNAAGMSTMKMGGKGTSGMQGMSGMGMKGGMKMDQNSDMKGMSGMQMGGDGTDQAMGMMGGMSGMQMGSGMGMEMMGKGMSMMGKMKGMGGMNMASSLPGFPGASHIYHVGANGFFLDHSDHIELTAEQQTKLNQLKEEQILKQADYDRQIESAEQELWILTSFDSPDAKAIEDKIAEISKIGGEQRFAYIRAVGEAAKTLDDDQRKALTGTMEKSQPDNHADHQKQ